jgi:hypothetical protein
MELTDEIYLQVFERVGKNDTQNVFTPPSLIRGMLSHVTFSENDKVLVWYNVEFLIFLVKEIGLLTKNIYIYTNTKDKLILEKQGYNVVYQENIDFDKLVNHLKVVKFDVVVGNPPFSKNKKEPKKLWSVFVEKSFELCKKSGKIALITPSSWISSTNYAHTFIKDKLEYVNISNKTSECFGNTGGTQKFIYFVANNKPTTNCITEFDDEVLLELNVCQTDYPPVKSTSNLLYSIVEKISKSNLPVHNWVRYDKINNESGVVVSMSKGIGYDITYEEIDGMIVSRYKLVCNEDHGIIIANNLNLKLYKILRWVIRSGPALAGNFKKLPIPSILITDNDLYEILSLTPEEIQYVEEY